MSWDDNDLVRALSSRAPSPDEIFRARLAAALDRGRPPGTAAPRWAIAATVLIAATVIGLMVGPRLVGSATPGAVKPSPTAIQVAASPSPQAWPSAQPSPPPGGPLVVLPASVWLSAPSQNVVWVNISGSAGVSYLFRSQDGGAVWEQRSMPQAQLLLDGLTFVDASVGWGLTYGSRATQCQADVGTVLHTEDGGTTWQDIGHSGIGDSQCKTWIQFVDTTHGFIGAGDPNSPPLIYRTSDGGRTWVPSTPLPDPPGRVTGPGGLELQTTPLARAAGVLLTDVAAGSGTPSSYVYQSTDGGATWSYAASLPSAGMATFLDATHWWVSGPGIWMYTADAGRSWGQAPSAAPYEAAVPPEILFVDPSVGYVQSRGLIFRTTDGGHTWHQLKTPGT